jgi:hypothetical protein
MTQLIEEGFDLPHDELVRISNNAAGDRGENLTRRLMLAMTSIKLAEIARRAEFRIFLAMLARLHERPFEPVIRREVA